jgi:hypothetical protein
MGAAIHDDAMLAAIVLAWIGIGMLIMGASFAARRLALEMISIGVLAGAALAWAVAYPGQVWSDFDAPALVHPGLIMLFFLTCAGLIAMWRVHAVGQPGATKVIRTAISVLVLLGLTATSLEVARIAEMATADPNARRAAVSMWWGAFAIGLIAAGFWRRIGPVRYCGLALIGIAVAKALVFDTLGVTPVWRVVSVIGLGLLLLVIAAAYAKLSSRLGLRSPRRDDRGQGLAGAGADGQVDL